MRFSRWRKVAHGDFAWASLENFWCVKGRYLARQAKESSNFNKVIGRKESKTEARNLANGGAKAEWLAGKQRESKKVFSFKEPEGARRTYGFVKPKMVTCEDIKKSLEKAWPDLTERWPDLTESEFQTGAAILNEFFQAKTKNPL